MPSRRCPYNVHRASRVERTLNANLLSRARWRPEGGCGRTGKQTGFAMTSVPTDAPTAEPDESCPSGYPTIFPPSPPCRPRGSWSCRRPTPSGRTSDPCASACST
ncbi:protein of unknown function [Azospirillum baldaniorum]|uniref:Uncharacterized protein n=1 Tax=Azospirillum baldaniorum TaxID=1064539 RepID=A0A9P1NN73_9PROT|nr:protein of unknown function [Azospirillum baldaniorum]